MDGIHLKYSTHEEDVAEAPDQEIIDLCASPINDRSNLKSDKDGKASTIQSINPFTKFAFQQVAETTLNSQKWVAPKRKLDTEKERNPRHAPKKSNSARKKDWVQMKGLSPTEQEIVRRKWHSLADPTAALEDRRFQVLVASRLHARCQEAVVRRCMQALREAFGGQLTAARLSQADPEVLSSVLSSLQFYNMKAKQIVKAAQEIQSHFGGIVPESDNDLQKITGVGPIMGDLLACINTRASYESSC